jgi:hypothetical protein
MRSVQQIRVDIPLKLSYAYLFVDPPQPSSYPWWGHFFEFLLSFGSDDLEWRLKTLDDTAIARPYLTELQQLDIVKFIRSAPKDQIEAHRTLRLAAAMSAEQVERLRLAYFSTDITGC